MSNSKRFSVLILGASYGLLPGARLSLAGHSVTLVGRKDEIAQIERTGVRIHLPARDRKTALVLRLGGGPVGSGKSLSLISPQDAVPNQYDLVILAMQEPQYGQPEVAALMGRIASAKSLCLSIMNMPPPPFLARIGSVDVAALRGAYGSADVWGKFDPALMTIASPDAQAMRPDPNDPGRLQVTLATNFKMAPFADPARQTVLDTIAASVDATRVEQGGQLLTPSVRFVAQQSVYVALAKWPMLIAGNCRSFTPDGPIPIKDAIWNDLKTSQEIYEFVTILIRQLGASETDVVPFERYAQAARELTVSSSLARALQGGATSVERIDLLVRILAHQQGAHLAELDRIVAQTQSRLVQNAG